MQHTLLKDINRQAYGWKILVRLAHLWEFKDQQTGTILYELDFVVVDREGGIMEGYVPSNRIDQIKSQLKQGSVYTFEQFGLSDARGLYKAVEHQYRICFTQRTKIKEFITYPPNFPVYAYNVKPFDILSTRTDNNTLLSDVIGLITAVSEVSVSPSTNQNKRQIFITNGSQRAIVTLWGGHAENFDADSIQRASVNQPMVALFVAMTVGQFSGMLAFKSTSATKWYINIDIPEMVAARHATRDYAHHIEWQGSFRPRGDPVDTTIVELVASEPYSKLGERFRIKVVILSVVTSENWWYLSCKSCWKKLVPDRDSFRCPRCSGTKGEARYKLVLEGTDMEQERTDEPKVAHFTFFGQQAVTIVGKDAALLVPDVTVQTPYIPPDLMAVIGNKYILTADLAEGSLDADDLCFQVNSSERIIEDKNIMPSTASTNLEQTPPVDVLQSTPPKDKGVITTSRKRGTAAQQNAASKRGAVKSQLLQECFLSVMEKLQRLKVDNLEK
ncbi:hypothetical protein ACQ4PT_016570 [Festuca glaucescens]